MIILRNFADFMLWEAKVVDNASVAFAGFVAIPMNGEDVYLASNLDAIKANLEIDEVLADALFQADIIKADDDGNFII